MQTVFVYTYIGQTYRRLLAHIADHKGRSIRASQPYPVPSNNNNCEHNIEVGVDMNKKKLSNCHATHEVLSKIVDSIFIRHFNPLLNNRESSTK